MSFSLLDATDSEAVNGASVPSAFLKGAQAFQVIQAHLMDNAVKVPQRNIGQIPAEYLFGQDHIYECMKIPVGFFWRRVDDVSLLEPRSR